MNVVCGFELREDPVLYLAEGDIDIRNRETPFPAYLLTNIVCIRICKILLENFRNLLTET